MSSISKKRHRDDAAFINRVFRRSDVPVWKRLRRFLAGVWLFILFGALVSVIAFWGRPPHSPVIYKGFEPNYTFRAPNDFEYKSEILRREREKEARAKTAQAYKVDMAISNKELATISLVGEKTAEQFDELKKLYVRSARVDAIKNILKKIELEKETPNFHNFVESLSMSYSLLIQHCDTREHYLELLATSERIYRRFAENGIYDSKTFGALRGNSQFAVFNGKAMEAQKFKSVFTQNVNTELWGKIFQNESFSNLSKVTQTIVTLFSDAGLMEANMLPDESETKRLQDIAASEVPDVMVKVHAGDPILIKGVRVTDEILERWKAFYADAANVGGSLMIGDSLTYNFVFYTLSTFCALLVGIIFCSLVIPGIFRIRKRRLWFAGTLILLSIVAIRGILELLEMPHFDEAFTRFENIQGWLAAPAVAAIIAATMVGGPFAIAISLFIGAIVTLMVGGSVGFFLTSMVAVLVSVYVSRGAMKRSTLVRAGVYAGLAVAATSLPVGLHAELPIDSIFYNIGVSIGVGFISGIAAAGVLSIFEGIFKITTNITLLELSDYNHPLLRKLQVVAPGTFHHSVMVADYAAKAASDVNANAALCRCAALYHDIGKTLKPEYFTENQNSGLGNPHDSITPSMSALIIKSHVREGAELAVEYHLPVPVREIIEQHHGTSLTGYFIRKARELATIAGEKTIVDESNYRYDGPKPQTVEAAIVMFCDVVEAASRSIKRVTSQGVEDMVNKLVMERFQEGELDECPITISEVYTVRKSLIASVLTTFHSRVEYPKEGESVLEKIRKDAEKPKVRVQAKSISTVVAKIRGNMEMDS